MDLPAVGMPHREGSRRALPRFDEPSRASTRDYSTTSMTVRVSGLITTRLLLITA